MMAKYRILAAAAAPGVMASLDAPGRAARVRGTCGAAANQIVPATWNGVGDPPRGWLLPWGTLAESNGARIAIIATDDFAAGRPEFSGALDGLPADWT